MTIAICNHAATVDPAIVSVLSQTYHDIKLLAQEGRATNGSLRLLRMVIEDPRTALLQEHCMDLPVAPEGCVVRREKGSRKMRSLVQVALFNSSLLRASRLFESLYS